MATTESQLGVSGMTQFKQMLKADYMPLSDRSIYLLAVKGLSPTINQCIDYTNKGLMKFTGNQWNEDWDWVDEELEKLTDDQLRQLLNTMEI